MSRYVVINLLILPFIVLLFSSGLPDQDKIFSSASTGKHVGFTEGIIYARTSFPDHPIDQVLQRINFNEGEVNRQYDHLKDSLGLEPQKMDDPMYMAAIYLSPVYTRSYFSKDQSLTRQYALGYILDAKIDRKSDSGVVSIRPYTGPEGVYIDFTLSLLKKVWERFEIDEEEYTVQKPAGTSVVAGHTCKKMIYSFSGTSRKPALSSRLIARIPWKVTVWYTGDIDPSINVQLPYSVKSDKAILKMEVYLDKEQKNKMIWEVVSIQPKQLTEEDFNVTFPGSLMHYPADEQKAISEIMGIMGKTLQSM